LLLTLFLTILLLNLIGAIPYSFTITARASLTFSISFSIWLGTVLLAFQLRGLNFFSMFLPANTPQALILLLVFVEIGSYLIKPFSLGIRLAANLTAGRLLLNLGASFFYFLLGTNFIILS
jgi:ATP synthase subunit 6